MKRIIHIIAFAATLLAAVSCVEPLNTFIPSQDLTLLFSNGAMTKATVDGIDNENLVKKIDYFIFPLNANGELLNGENTEYAFKHTIGSGTDAVTMPYTETIGRSELAAIFPNGTKAKIFAVVNYVDKDGAAVTSPVTTIPTTAKTWKALHELEVGETFFKDGGSGFGLRWPRKMEPNDSKLFFVMTGEKVIDMYASAEDNKVPLERLASKVTVSLKFGEPIVDDMGTPNDATDDITWVPQPSGNETRVYLSNAIEHTMLGGPLTRTLVPDQGASDDVPANTTKPAGDGTRDIFEYAYDFLKDITTTNADGDKVTHYYTYPISMQGDNILGDDNQSYLKLVLPWYGYKHYESAQNPGTFAKEKEVYYKIVIPQKTIDKGNHIYEFTVDVNIIGNDKEVNIVGDYIVKDWPDSREISSNVATGRYISLDIPKDEYDMYTDLVDIAFVSSGEVEISQLKIYQDDFSSANSTVIDFITGKNGNTYTYGSGKNANTEDIAGNKLPNWVKIDGRKLVVQHQMNNDFSDSSFDAAPMTFVVTLHLKGETETTFDRTVTITQYPALYVTKDAHYGHVFVNKYGGTNSTVSTWDNRGTQSTSAQSQSIEGTTWEQYFLGNLLAANTSMTGSGNNNNPNNYNVYVSVLANNTKGWVIGDPRDKTAGPVNYIGTSDDPLTYYHKTLENADLILAPAFKIASSYGMCANANITYENAVKRCASYQENGYPAGRWRIPTQAEIEFVISLTTYNKIPSLFQGWYWASNKKVRNNNTGEFEDSSVSIANGRGAVRCVYDVWYWGEEKSEECYTGTDSNGNKLYNQWGGFQD